MPRVEVTSVVVSQIWDDGCIWTFEIDLARFADGDPYVSVTHDDETIYFCPDSWPEIRDQIQSMLDSVSETGELE